MAPSFKKVSGEKILHFIRLLMLSGMPRAERRTWVRLLPVMNEREIGKFTKILGREAEANADILLDVLAARQKRRKQH